MAARMTVDEIRRNFSPGLTTLFDGVKMYGFDQKQYFEDFIAFYDRSYNLTSEKMAWILFPNYDENDHSKKIKRANGYLLFGQSIRTRHTQNELIDMLFTLQDDPIFNPQRHCYIDELARQGRGANL